MSNVEFETLALGLSLMEDCASAILHNKNLSMLQSIRFVSNDDLVEYTKISGLIDASKNIQTPTAYATGVGITAMVANIQPLAAIASSVALFGSSAMLSREIATQKRLKALYEGSTPCTI